MSMVTPLLQLIRKPKVKPTWEMFDLFGVDVVFFPFGPQTPGKPQAWKDAHSCLKCGALVQTGTTHLWWHRDLTQAIR